MAESKKVKVGLVYSAKVGSSWLPVRIDKSLGHGRYQGASMPSGTKLTVPTTAIKGDGQTVEQWEKQNTPKPDETPAPAAAPTADGGAGSKKSAAAEQPAKAKKERKTAGPRKSLANAAVLVLADAKEPMNAKAIVEKATADGLYEPGKGKTPHATLYSAMLREARETDGRFQKTHRGLWELTAAGKTQVDAVKEAFAAK
jgi:hypothetical protein